MLTINDYKSVSLPGNWHNCSVDVASSWYIGCGGSGEVPFRNQNLFTIVRGVDPSDIPYFLQVRLGGIIGLPGRDQGVVLR